MLLYTNIEEDIEEKKEALQFNSKEIEIKKLEKKMKKGKF